MKKIGIILFGMLLILFIGISNVIASGTIGTVTIEKADSTDIGTTGTLIVKVQTEGDAIGVITGKIKTEGNVRIKQVTGKNGWSLTYNDQEGEDQGAFNLLKAAGAKSEEIMEIHYIADYSEGEVRIILEEINLTNIKYKLENIGNITFVENETIDQPEKTLTSIEITTAPTKTVYEEGEKFDKSGMVVTAKYSDGSSKIVTNYTCEPTETLKLTDKAVTIKYTEEGITKTVEQEIEVNERDNDGGDGDQPEKTLTSIEITKAPTKTVYKKGEKFDKTGMEVVAKYSDGSSKVVTNYTCEPTESLKLTDKTVTIKYTEEGITKTVEQEIKVQEAADDKEKPDNTVSDKDYPDTGINMLIIPMACIVIIGVVSYIGYRKYKNI
ncbi:MAG: bacterial Ig-like domain-containing protein [Clostridia bacterium]|nr:bacterial Ig-like domain-containing protein [Clostridia bacterium]